MTEARLVTREQLRAALYGLNRSEHHGQLCPVAKGKPGACDCWVQRNADANADAIFAALPAAAPAEGLRERTLYSLAECNRVHVAEAAQPATPVGALDIEAVGDLIFRAYMHGWADAGMAPDPNAVVHQLLNSARLAAASEPAGGGERHDDEPLDAL